VKDIHHGTRQTGRGKAVTKMKIKINGKEELVESSGLSVTELLALKKVQMPDMVSVEYNGTILDRSAFSATVVKEGDAVEFLYFMGGGQEHDFQTKAVHGGYIGGDQFWPGAMPIYETAAFACESAEEMADLFAGRKYGYIYSRTGNPTITAFEQKLNSLDNGRGAVATASGMAAITSIILALTESGDEIAASSGLFGGTILLFKDVLKKYGVNARYAKSQEPSDFEAVINEKTRAIYVETIGNPKLDIPDLAALSALGKKYNIPLIADATLSTPYLLEAKKFGVDIAVYSTTKYITGSGTAIGGAFVDLGNFDWANAKSAAIKKVSARFRDLAFLVVSRKQIVQNTGSCTSPFHAYLQNMGLETLSLRLDRHSANAQQLAEFLEKHPAVKEASYPGLKGNKYHEIAKKQFNGLYSGLVTFKLDNREKCFSFINKLKLVKKMTNFGDAKTLVIHPLSTIYIDCTPEEAENAGVTDDLIRVSVGLESIKDLIADFEQALS
jgi:O-acetylhomoserine (thiol)-lyase